MDYPKKCAQSRADARQIADENPLTGTPVSICWI